MHRIDSAGTAAALPAPAAVGATVGFFTEGNAGVGTPATLISGDWLNAVQEELVNVILGAGIALDKTKRDQLLSAIRTLANFSATAVAGANHAVVAADAFKLIERSNAGAVMVDTLPGVAPGVLAAP